MRAGVVGAATLFVAAVLGALPGAVGAQTVDEADTYPVSKVTGPGPPNFTAERWNVWGTDLGHMFEHEGDVWMAFGDTLGPRTDDPLAATRVDLCDCRSNVLARLKDSDPALGPRFAAMIEDRPGHAGELLDAADEPVPSVTVIPTAGISVDGRMYLHYMSVAEWGPPGHWHLTRAGLAYSDDDGRTWTKDPRATWPWESNFGQVSLVEVGRRVYVFGIPGGRYGGVKLARVRAEKLLDPRAYAYWNGEEWTDRAAEIDRIMPSSSLDTPVSRRSDYGLVVDPTVSELSVQWSPHYRKWLMLYGKEGEGPVLRTADCLTGPWSEEQVVAGGTAIPTGYAPYLAPRWNNGADIYFTLSVWGVSAETREPAHVWTPAVPYNVFWMHTSLDDVPPAPSERCVSPPA